MNMPQRVPLDLGDLRARIAQGAREHGMDLGTIVPGVPRLDTMRSALRTDIVLSAWPSDTEPAAPTSTVSATGAPPYRLADFERWRGADFVRMAYRLLLKREAERSAVTHYVGLLGAGVSRGELLARLRYSSEGRRAAVPVRGLWPRAAIGAAKRVPVLGYVVALCVESLKLPHLAGRLCRLEDEALRRGEATGPSASWSLAVRRDLERIVAELNTLRRASAVDAAPSHPLDNAQPAHTDTAIDEASGDLAITTIPGDRPGEWIDRFDTAIGRAIPGGRVLIPSTALSAPGMLQLAGGTTDVRRLVGVCESLLSARGFTEVRSVPVTVEGPLGRAVVVARAPRGPSKAATA